MVMYVHRVVIKDCRYVYDVHVLVKEIEFFSLYCFASVYVDITCKESISCIPRPLVQVQI